MTFAFAPLSYTLPYWPEHLFGHPAFLDRVGISAFEVEQAPGSLAMSGTLNILDKLETKLPALDKVSVAFFPDATGSFTEVQWSVDLEPDFAVTLKNLTVELRVESDLLRAVKQDGSGKWVPLTNAQNNPKPVAVKVSGADAKVSGDGDIEILGTPAITMTPIAIGDSGIVVEVNKVTLHLSDQATPPANAPPGFKGVAIGQIAVHLGDTFEDIGGPDTITADDLFIGSSGFSGTIAAEWQTPPAGKLLGLPFTPTEIGIDFAQNKLIGMSLKGALTLPFFDEALDVEVGYDAKNGFTVGVTAAGGIFTLTKPGFLKVAVESLAITVHDKKAKIALSGEITPLFGALDWPSFEVRELSIDSEGHVALKDGWIDLPKQVALNFHAFTVQITKFGMGKKDNAKWFGCSCTVNLIKGVQGKGSVEGLRLFLYDDGRPPGFSFEGIAVEMKMGGAFDLKGSGRFIDEAGNKRFDGAAMLALKKPELAFDTQLTIGRMDDPILGRFPYFGVYAGLELPFGIPIGSLPFSLYGFALMFALHMRPGRTPGQAWYSLPPDEGWYNKHPVGVAELVKWAPKKDAKAIGIGATLGTSGGGYPFNMKGLLVISFPGIVVFLEALGNICKERKALAAGDEPLFRSIAILDFEAGEFTFGLDAAYKYDSSGGVVDIRGSAEAFFSQANPLAWHLWVGKDEPIASRVHARIVSLFEANAYFMIGAGGIKTGCWVGYDKSWNLSPLSVTLQAWLDANAGISFKPPHFHTDLWMHAALKLSAFGFGVGLSADALLAADVVDPFHIRGELTVSLNLPKPFKKGITKTLELEWGPRKTAPPVPIVLKGVGIEHLKSSAVWPLAIGQTVVPDYGDADGFLAAAPPLPTPPPAAIIPIVPMDAVISVAFARSVHDDSQIGVNAVMPSPDFERIGDPAKNQGPAQVRFALKAMVLEKLDPASATWVGVAGKGPGAEGLPKIYGAWGAIPAGPVPGPIAQTNLMLWSKTAFHQTRLTGDAWNDWFAANHPNYPCVEAPPLRCYDFEGYDVLPLRDADGNAAESIFHRSNPNLAFGSNGPLTVEALASPVNGRTHVLRPIQTAVAAEFLGVGIGPPGARYVRIIFDGIAERIISVVEFDPAGVRSDRQFTDRSAQVELRAEGWIQAVFIFMLAVPRDDFSKMVERLGIVEVCLGSGGADDQYLQALAANLKSATSHWQDEDNVLEPFTDYRLAIATEALVIEELGPTTPRHQTSFAYFRTGGPPGLGGFTTPAGQTADTIAGGPDNLANYVAQTIPATIGRGDDAPAMPRPVFRAYDKGVKFNANHADLLYKMARRDLRLQILDSNGEPARDAIGAALAFENPWGVTSGLELDDASVAWLAAVDPLCVPIDRATIAHNKTLGTSATPLLLAPATRYRARLTPLLLHEDFAAPHRADGAVAGAGGRIGDWLAVELDSPPPGSHWTVHNSASANGIYVEQDLALAGTGTAASDCPPGSALVWAPATMPAWKRQRLAAFVQAGAGGAVGLVFLYRDASNYFAVALRPNGVCRLVRRTNAGAVKLAQAQVAFAAGTDAELVIEASDNAIRLFVDGAAVLTHAIDLKAEPGGTIGLWCWNDGAARFKDVRVEDQSAGALASFGFDFVTSAYVNYAHLAHGRRTPVWDIETAGGDKERSAAALAALSSASVQQSDAALGATEMRQYEDLAKLWLGPFMVRDPAVPEVNVILRGGEAVGWLVRSPEPWDWARSELGLWRAAQPAPLSQMLGPAKIVGAALGHANGDDEYVDLLGLDDVALAGWRLQLRDATTSSTGLVSAPFDDPASIWSDLHLFPAQASIGAGLMLRLYSGGTVQPAANHTWRTMNIAPAGDPGVARLPGVGADLRLLDASGRTACAVRILPDTAFAPVSPAPRLLRKADATGLIVLPGAGQPVAPGAYRLRMRYRRDLSAIDADAILLSQAGDTSDELAHLPLY